MNCKIILFLLTLLLYGCGKENIVPNIKFDVLINLSDPEYANKEVLDLGDVKDLNTGTRVGVGYSGVIVYRSARYVAFEKYCPHDQSNSCKATVKKNETTKAVCNCCKTEFLLLTGEVVLGESKYGLKEYKTELILPQNLLRIWN